MQFLFHNVIIMIMFHVFAYCPINIPCIHYISTVKGTDSFIYFATTQDELMKGMR